MTQLDYTNESDLREAYLTQDRTQAEIADECGVSESTISNWVRHFDIEKTRAWEDPDRLHDLYWDEGLSIKEVADRLDTGRDIIHKWMVRLDVPRRRNGVSHEYWYDEAVLRELYGTRGLSQREISNKFGVAPSTVGEAMADLGIEARGVLEAASAANRVQRCYFRTKRGYEIAGSRCGESTHEMMIHQLVAVAEYGFDAVVDRVVHHRNEFSWDNRPANLVPMTDSEHKRYHAETRGEVPPEGFGSGAPELAAYRE